MTDQTAGSYSHALTDAPHVAGILTEAQVGALQAVAQHAPHWFVAGAKWTNDKGQPKAPGNPATMRNASASDMATAADFTRAISRLKGAEVACVGVALKSATPRLVVLDFDHVRDKQTGEMHGVGRAALGRLKGQYVEVSPSGTGLRAVVFCDGGPVGDEDGKGGKEVHKLGAIGPDGGEVQIELFGAGQNAYCRMTGALVAGVGVAQVGEAPPALLEWVRGLRVAGKGPAPTTTATTPARRTAQRDPWSALEEYRGNEGRSVDEVVASIQKTAREKPRGDLAKAVDHLRSGHDGDSEGEMLICCEAIRRGAGNPDDLWDVLLTLAGPRARKKLQRDDYIDRTTELAAKAVLKQIEEGSTKYLRRETWQALPRPDNDDFSAAPAIAPEVVEALQAEGLELTKGKGGKVEASTHNARVLLLADPKVRGLLKFNEVTQQAERADAFYPFNANANGAPGPIADVDVWFVRAWLDQVHKLRLTTGDTWEAVHMAARARSYDGLRDALEDLVWDGVHRLGQWLVDHALVDDKGVEDYVQEAGICWFVGAVRRALEPGSKADEVLCVEGAGGGGKSTMFSVLADVLGEGLYTDAISNVTKAEHRVEATHGKLIVEVAELSGFRRAEDQEALKAALSARVERVRKPYAREPVEIPRRFVFVATTNRSEYLADPTGALARRFWPVRTMSSETRQIDMHRLREIAPQLWAEAVHLCKAGRRSYIEPGTRAFEQWVLARGERQETLPYQSEIEQVLIAAWEGDAKGYDLERGTTAKTLAKAIGIDDRYAEPQIQNRLTAAMQAAGLSRWKKSGGVHWWRASDIAIKRAAVALEEAKRGGSFST